MEKKHFFLLVLLVFGLVCVVLVILYGAFGQKLGIRLSLSPSPTPIQVGGNDTLRKAVVKTTFQNGDFFYSVNGHFVDRPSYQDDMLRGEFIIDGDTIGTRIQINMGSKKGTMNFGVFQGSLIGNATWRLVPTDEVKSRVMPEKPAQLRLVYQKDQQLSEFDQQTIAIMNQLAGGSFSLPERFVIVPMMVGVVGN